jgi:D-glycero-D-manno-heptose 1,7-bisphosphate phosphatase
MALSDHAAAGPLVFLDKDGTLIENVPYNVNPDRIELTPHAAAGLQVLCSHGFRLAVITNQPGIALGLFAIDALAPVERRLRELLASHGVSLAGFYFCPHEPKGCVAPFNRACYCRKPAPGLLLDAANTLGGELATSWFVGDILDDVEAGRRAGCRTILLDRGHETEWRLTPLRVPHRMAYDLEEAARIIVGESDTTQGLPVNGVAGSPGAAAVLGS